MRYAIFTFTAHLPDETTDEQIRDMATRAFVQIEDPDNGASPTNVASHVTVNGELLGGDYDAECRAATTRQGLDPAIEALRDAGVVHELEQTGGFCMAVTVRVPDGTLVVSQSDLSSQQVTVGFYPGDTWEEGEEHAEIVDVTVAQLVDHVRRYLSV